MRVRRARSALVAALALALLVPPAGAQGRPFATTTGRSEPIYSETVQEEYRIPTRFGRIYGVVVRPVVPEGVKVPVILTYSPYNVTRRSHNAASYRDRLSDFFVPRGYARAVFDLVGTRESGGCYDYGGIRERKTAAAVVDYLGSRDWSNGKVGMIGVSYDGTTPWAAAGEAPKHLTTIVPQVGIGRWWDYAYGQGIRFYSGSGTPYLFDFGFGFLPPTDPRDPHSFGESAADHMRPCERVEHNERAFLPDPVYDGFWDERDYLSRIHRVRASVMIEGSWRDYNVHAINSIEMWDGLPDAHPKKLVMGQQGHDESRLIDAQNIRHAWFDHWLLGLDTGIMDLPRVDSDTGFAPGTRFQDEEWPPRGTRRVGYRLVARERSNAFVLQDKQRAVWTDDEPLLNENIVLDGLAGDAAITFLGGVEPKDVRIAGIPKLDAWLISSGESTFLTPVLFDVGPNSTRVIARGLLNSRNRESNRTSLPLIPGEAWRGRVYFQPIDWVVKRGHRLGLAVMSMNSYEALYPDDIRSTNEILLDGRSRLIVPRNRDTTIP
ncbi:MAG TPA: CocE/NonD family hydrolase [Actinomycetota bacterium]|nr:CocE/NonD family hydrolase [Actinomycetota bacterium]